MTGKGAGVLVWVFFVLFFAIGAGILCYALFALSKSRQVENWPTTWGTLLERDLVENSDSDGTTYRKTVRYRYQVAGVTYDAERIAFGYGGSSGYEMHSALYERLQSGESVRVHYNPDDHSEAALAGGLNKSTVFLLVFGGIWTVFTLGIFLLMRLVGSADSGMLERLIVR